MTKLIGLILLFMFTNYLSAQTTVGIGLYPTGTETGLGFRSDKDAFVCADVRVTKASILSKPSLSSFLIEASAVFRLIRLEKVRFHLGLGFRGEWNFDRANKMGAVIPVGVEAFPFPFQNAGLFFEAAPYYTQTSEKDFSGGIRTVAGFIFYFIAKKQTN